MVTSQTDSANSPLDSPSEDDEFMRLFVRYQRVLLAYLRTALRSPVDVEEVFQETSVILWRSRQKFVKGTSFVNWMTTIAHNEVRRFRRSCKHVPQILDEGLLNQMAAEIAAQCELVEIRQLALEQCMQTLSEHERNLINAAYGAKASKKSVGQGFGMTPNGFYKALNRIRQRLLKCIQRRLLTEEFT